MISDTARYYVARYSLAHIHTGPRPHLEATERALLHFIGALETKLGMLEGENRHLIQLMDDIRSATWQASAPFDRSHNSLTGK